MPHFSNEFGKRSFSCLAPQSGMEYLLISRLSTPLNAVWKLALSNSPSTSLPCCPPSDCRCLWFSITSEYSHAIKARWWWKHRPLSSARSANSHTRFLSFTSTFVESRLYLAAARRRWFLTSRVGRWLAKDSSRSSNTPASMYTFRKTANSFYSPHQDNTCEV